jgi:sulfur-oxidizing protein SoxZ
MKVKAKLKGTNVEVKLLAKHPMHTGRVTDPVSKELIPANFIKTLSCYIGEKKIFQGNFGTGVSKDPFLKLTFINRKAGEILKFEWIDLTGKSEVKEVVI